MHLKIDGSVQAVGNPWFVPGASTMAVGGVRDLTRLPARTPGAPEFVATVGTAGVQVIGGGPAGFTVTPWNRPELVNGLQIRAAAAGPYVAVGVLAADARTLRFYRVTVGGVEAGGVVVMPTTVGDFELLGDSSGDASAMVLTTGELRSVTFAGGTRWSVAGGRGDLAAFPGHGSARIGWMRKDASNQWEVVLFGSGGQVDCSSVSAWFGSAEVVIGTFAGDVSGDGVTDWVVKTSTRLVRVHGAAGAAMFAAGPAMVVRSYPGIATSIPDLVASDLGRQSHLVDEHAGDGGATWTPVHAGDFGPPLALRQAVSTSERHVVRSANGRQPGDTVLDTAFVVAGDVRTRLAPDPTGATKTQLQITTWRVDGPGAPTQGGGEGNFLIPLSGEGDLDPLAAASIRLRTTMQITSEWNDDTHYWLIARVCRTNADSTTVVAASAAVPFALTIQTSGVLDLTYLRSRAGVLQSSQPLHDEIPDIGGSIVGVITEYPVPPPAGVVPVPPAVEPGG